jgi:meiosis-specific transcription factor NDT80
MDISRPSYTSTLPDTPRTMMSPHATFSPNAVIYGHAGYGTHAPTRGPQETPPFQEQEDLHRIEDGQQTVRPTIHAKIEKGFFLSGDGCWTCYRRNYFSVQCSHSLDPHPAGRQLYLYRQDGKSGRSHPEQIQALAMSLSAVVDGSVGKSIDLVQHTPKRDKGPQSAIRLTKISPQSPGSKTGSHHGQEPQGYFSMANTQASGHSQVILPLQSVPELPPPSSDPSNPSSGQAVPNTTPPYSASHTFERIQFKSATANNGKRRAQQQYYHLIVELWADVRSGPDKAPEWVKIAQRPSSQVVVRGRSPSHYQNEGPNSVGRGGGGGASGMGGARHGLSGGSWASGAHPPYGGNSSSLGSLSSYNINHGRSGYSMSEHQLPPPMQIHGDHMRSLPSAAGASSGLLAGSDEETKPSIAYSYHPGPLYEANLASGLGIKPEQTTPGALRGDDGGHLHGIPLMAGQNCRPHSDMAAPSSRGHYQYVTPDSGNGL